MKKKIDTERIISRRKSIQLAKAIRAQIELRLQQEVERDAKVEYE
jgi:hypothetical protein